MSALPWRCRRVPQRGECLPKIGAAIVGTGFMGTVHAEALLRGRARGRHPRLEPREIPQGRRRPRPAQSLRDVRRGARRRRRPVGPPRHAEPPALLPGPEALLAGKHVLCEKPLAMEPKESAALVALARERPKQAAGVNYNVRFYPLCLEARERARRGDLGTIYHATGCYAQDWLLKESDYNWRVLAEEGGALRGDGRHRHPLARPDPRHHRAGGRFPLRRPQDRPPDPPPSRGRGRDLPGQGPARRHARPDHHRRLRRRLDPLPGRGSRLRVCLAGGRRPQEPADLRNLGLRSGPGLGRRSAG